MVAHASMCGVMEFTNDLLGVSISPGTVHNIHQRAARHAIAINDSIDLSAIRVVLHDGISGAPSRLSPALIRPPPIAICWLAKTTAMAIPGPEPRVPRYPMSWRCIRYLSQFETPVNIWTRIASGVRTQREALEARLANPRRRRQDSLIIARSAKLRSRETRAH
jgi:hypothetical protein